MGENETTLRVCLEALKGARAVIARVRQNEIDCEGSPTHPIERAVMEAIQSDYDPALAKVDEAIAAAEAALDPRAQAVAGE